MALTGVLRPGHVALRAQLGRAEDLVGVLLQGGQDSGARAHAGLPSFTAASRKASRVGNA